MPSGLTKDQQAYAMRVFADLLETQGWTQVSLGEKLDYDQSRISQVKQTGKTSLTILIKAAKLAGRSDAEIAKVVGFTPVAAVEATALGPGAGDPKFGTFLLRLGEVPGLRTWLNEHPEGATIGEVWAGIQAYEKTPTLSRANDGQPAKGWESFFADLRAGRIGVPSAEGGDAAAVLALERAERPALPPTNVPKKKSRSKPKEKR